MNVPEIEATLKDHLLPYTQGDDLPFSEDDLQTLYLDDEGVYTAFSDRLWKLHLGEKHLKISDKLLQESIAKNILPQLASLIAEWWRKSSQPTLPPRRTVESYLRLHLRDLLTSLHPRAYERFNNLLWDSLVEKIQTPTPQQAFLLSLAELRAVNRESLDLLRDIILKGRTKELLDQSEDLRTTKEELEKTRTQLAEKTIILEEFKDAVTEWTRTKS